MARTAVITILFFGSGAVALAFEGLWFAQAGLAFGNSTWASSLVLSGFMAGMALGNLAGARFGGRVRNPLGVYALLELIVAAAGLALVFELPAVGYAIAAGTIRLRSTESRTSFLWRARGGLARNVTLPCGGCRCS